MAFKIVISEAAKKDFEEQYLYYRLVATKKVADKFFKAFQGTVRVLSQNPYFRISHDNFRMIPVQNYPFIVFFFLDEKEQSIVIARVFHTSQNPKKYP